MSSKFDNSYVMLQVRPPSVHHPRWPCVSTQPLTRCREAPSCRQALAGFVVGCCYCMRLAVTGSVFECFVLHMANNALACLVPADGTISFTDTSKLLPRTLVAKWCCGHRGGGRGGQELTHD